MSIYSLCDGLRSVSEKLLQDQWVAFAFPHPGCERVPGVVSVVDSLERTQNSLIKAIMRLMVKSYAFIRYRRK